MIELLLFAGVLSHLSLLEAKTRSLGSQPQQLKRVEELKAKVKALRAQRDQLKTELQRHKVRKTLVFMSVCLQYI